MIIPVDFQSTIESAFLKYGASVAQERSIPDVRDGLKIGLRQGLYAQYCNKLTHKNKFQKAQKSVASAMAQSYVHGDAAMYNTFIRAAKPWAYRYPIEEVQGSYGDPRESDNHSASRYVEMRAGELAEYFFAGLKKNCLSADEWYDNYDDTEKIPSVFPSIGFWNLVNGCSGIAVAMAISVPQMNLREVNNALITLIRNPDADFDEYYCPPDFATGGTIINGDEVKESMRNGEGAAIKLRAKLEYHPENRMIQCTEIPYGVFTNTIISQLAELTDADENYGIERVIDHTKKVSDIRIYLSESANPKKMIEKLYKDTSLESFVSINMIMLDMGRFPKLFTWRAACQAYIDHISICKRREYEYEHAQFEARNHIIDGLLFAIAKIDDVIVCIRGSENGTVAKTNLISQFGFTEPQAKAILDLKLQRLAKLDSIKLEQEHADNDAEIEKLNVLLNNKDKFNDSLIEILESVANKFGDERRTKIINMVESDSIVSASAEDVIVMVLSNNCLRVVKSEDMTGSKKGRKGTNLKLPDNVIIKDTLNTDTQSKLCVITDSGKVYFVALNKMLLNADNSIYEHLNLNAQERIVKVVSAEQFDKGNLVMMTKLGYIKKSEVSEYNTNGRGVMGIKLNDGDSVIAAFLSINDDDEIIMVNNHGYYNRYKINAINTTGRVTKGVQATKLKDDEYLVAADMLYSSSNYIGVLTINNHGQGKITELSQLPLTSRTSHGNLVQKLDDGDSTMVITAIRNSTNLIHIMSNKRLITINIAEVPIANRVTKGVKLIDIRGVVTDLYAIAK